MVLSEVFMYTPVFLTPYYKTKALLRLQKISMNCGMNETSFPRFVSLPYYSRYEHSVNCALLAYHFTHDKAETLACLFHDIATPVFAHTIDFLNGDYLTQESTEAFTHELIKKDADIMKLLKKDGLTLSQVDDYHQYPICDNNSPKLSCDRLEYTLSNSFYYGFAKKDTLKRIVDDLTITTNENGQKELAFRNKEIAMTFGMLSLKCSNVYTCDEDRFGMEMLARVVKKAMAYKVLTFADLYTTEDVVISKIKDVLPYDWQQFTSYHALEKHPKDGIIVQAKKRYIDPLVVHHRLSEEPRYKKALDAYLETSFDRPLKALG
jgi:HD superfamily phosphohydrolase